MEYTEVVEKRRASRALEPVEISEDFIKEIAYIASRAPSCGNMQPWRYLFLKDKTILSQFHEALTGGNYWAKEASLLIVVFSKKEYGCQIGEREYYLFGTGMATQQLMLAIVNKGLVAHAMAGFSEKKAKEILNIPEDMRIIAVIAVGKKSKNLSKLGQKHQDQEETRSKRRDFQEFAYIDVYTGED